jgi:hypothetical protein
MARQLQPIQTTMNIRKLISRVNLLARLRSRSSRPRGATARRLASEVALLDSLDQDRKRFNDPAFGKIVEESIVWRELLDLQMQEIDEHIGSI